MRMSLIKYQFKRSLKPMKLISRLDFALHQNLKSSKLTQIMPNLRNLVEAAK